MIQLGEEVRTDQLLRIDCKRTNRCSGGPKKRNPRGPKGQTCTTGVHHQQRAVEKVKVIFCTDNRCTGKHTHKVIDEKYDEDMEPAMMFGTRDS